VADKVIRLTPCPVLVVHDEPDLPGSVSPLVATDLSPNSAAALPLASALATATGTTVELLHVFDARGTTAITTADLDERVRGFARAYAPDAGFRFSTTVVVTGESVENAAARHLGLRRTGVIVMSTAGREPTEHHLLGRAPSRLAREVSAPLLLVTPESVRDARRALLVG
jgi:nucleotide-binding universal stress UspA family protein